MRGKALTSKGLAGDRTLQGRLRGASRDGGGRAVCMLQKSQGHAGEDCRRREPSPGSSPSMQ